MTSRTPKAGVGEEEAMERNDGSRNMLIAATAFALVAVLSPVAGATERQSDGWLHGAEVAAPAVTDGWMISGSTYQAPQASASVTDGWETSLATIERLSEGTDDRPSFSLASVREANGTSTGPADEKITSVSEAVTDGWLHSNAADGYRPSPAVANRDSGTGGISIELAAGMSLLTLVLGFAFAGVVTSRRYRHVRPA